MQERVKNIWPLTCVGAALLIQFAGASTQSTTRDFSVFGLYDLSPRPDGVLFAGVKNKGTWTVSNASSKVAR